MDISWEPIGIHLHGTLVTCWKTISSFDVGKRCLELDMFVYAQMIPAV